MVVGPYRYANLGCVAWMGSTLYPFETEVLEGEMGLSRAEKSTPQGIVSRGAHQESRTGTGFGSADGHTGTFRRRPLIRDLGWCAEHRKSSSVLVRYRDGATMRSKAASDVLDSRHPGEMQWRPS